MTEHVPIFGAALLARSVTRGSAASALGRGSTTRFRRRLTTVRTWAWRLLTICAASVAGPVLAQTTMYIGKSISLVTPPGQCLLGDSKLERDVKDRAANAMTGYNHVLAVFGECREVAQLRAGKAIPFSSFGQILTAQPKGKPVTMGGMGRADYLARMRKQAGDFNDAFRRMKEDLKSRNPLVGTTQNLGVLGMDHAAAYVGMLQDLPKGDGTATPGTGVIAFTTVQDVPITINFYRRGQGAKVLDEMVKTQAATAAGFVAANR